MVYVIIPAHNNKPEVLEVLACLQHQTYRSFVVVLVDDGSTDGTKHAVKESFPDTVILKGNGNLWWTGANVVGMEYVLREAQDDDFVLLLNNDLLIDEDYLQIMVQAATTHEHTVVGSTLVDIGNPEFMESGLRFDRFLNLMVNRDRSVIDTTDFDTDVDTLPGRGTLVPIFVFKEIGTFDVGRLPHYGADYEFFVRARRAGYRLQVSHRARVFAKLHITGLQAPETSLVPLKECLNLLLSKKSKMNLVYYLNYVWLCSERQYRVGNLLRGALGTLSQTLLKTLPFLPLRFFITIVLRAVRMVEEYTPFFAKFLFHSYPLRTLDITGCGLAPGVLLRQELLQEAPFKGTVYYYLTSMHDHGGLTEGQRQSLLQLRDQSFSYRHKLNIVREKVVRSLSRDATP